MKFESNSLKRNIIAIFLLSSPLPNTIYMKLQLPKINYTLLTYFIAALIGILLFLYQDADTRYMYILLSLAVVFILSTSCFHALSFRSYRTVLWPFILNILLILAFTIANGGTDNAPFFGSDNISLSLFFIILGFNAHWYILIESQPISDFSFLLINALLSFVIPSIGYAMGYLYTSKIRQTDSTFSNSQ